MPTLKYSLITGTLIGIVACDLPWKATCTDEERMNICATVGGRTQVSDSVDFIREHESGRRDSVAFGTCFSEHVGRQRILAYSGDSLLAASEWFRIKKVDGCHGEDRTVNFELESK